MFDYIEKINKKPEEERKAVALTITGIITGIIVVIWVISVFSQLGSAEEEIVNPTENSISPFETLKENIDNVIDSELQNSQ